MDIQTRLVHAGEERIEGAVVLPVFQSSTFVSQDEQDYNDIRYLRLNNTPNHRALHAKLATACGGEDALVTGSGMAAITTALMTVLNSGDHLLIQDCLYGGTHSFVTQDAPRLGIDFDFIAGNAPETWAGKLRPETRAIYVETMTNPLLEVADLEAVVEFARENGLVSLIDNTFASPCNFRPLEIGFDIELHSATKYLNGHSDLVAGAITGSSAHVQAIRHKLNHLGGSLDTHACFLLHRGLKTLALRMRQHDENGLTLARFLTGQKQVARVNYPGLESHPQYERAHRLFAAAGGVLSFELRGGVASAERLLSGLSLPVTAPSLGGVETLITRPAATSHSGMSPEDRAELGITDGLVRVACGIEAAGDLCADFAKAFADM
ncbi:MAG: aminotransferase class I/II-fold pyridoxal phosphate-dependent enzyme [Gemmatimonadetes bacterium]|nr:aminotransferase class I/II-fold pyridoxal phosphate-dependent enzyme [Gemmatimonadota bacterium]